MYVGAGGLKMGLDMLSMICLDMKAEIRSGLAVFMGSRRSALKGVEELRSCHYFVTHFHLNYLY